MNKEIIGICEFLRVHHFENSYKLLDYYNKCNKQKEVLDKIKENTERTIEIIKQQPAEDDTWILERLNSNLKILEEIE